VAEEREHVSTDIHRQVATLLEGRKLTAVPHVQLEAMLPDVKLVVRTGECSHHANVILVAGTTF